MAWLKAKQAAEYSGRHPETLREAMRGGELRGVQNGVGGVWLTKEEWIDEWILKRAAA